MCIVKKIDRIWKLRLVSSQKLKSTKLIVKIGWQECYNTKQHRLKYWSFKNWYQFKKKPILSNQPWLLLSIIIHIAMIRKNWPDCRGWIVFFQHVVYHFSSLVICNDCNDWRPYSFRELCSGHGPNLKPFPEL